MRPLVVGLCLLALPAAAQQAPNHSFPVFFTPFSSVLDVPATMIVNQAAAVARQFPDAKLTVVGYADPVGTPEQNQALSQARADAVKAQLIEDGVTEAAISLKAGGTPPDSQPGVEDRRAEIDVDTP